MWPGVQTSRKEEAVMSGSTANIATLQQRIRGLIAGTQKHSPNGSLTLGSVTYTAPALVQILKSLAEALDAADTAKASWKDALKRVADTKATVGPVVRYYRSWVEATHAGTPSTLADYGVTPRKEPAPLTAEEKATAVLKREATRAARHTMGKIQKKSVKGTVAKTAPATPSTGSTSIAQSSATSAPAQGTVGAAAPRPLPRD
jgi:hypothetical protein